MNDDAAPVLSVSNASLVEGNTGTRKLSFTVSLTGDTELPASAGLRDRGRAPLRPAPTSCPRRTSSRSPTGDTSALVEVAVKGDRRYEPNETLTLTAERSDRRHDRRRGGPRHDPQRRQGADRDHAADRPDADIRDREGTPRADQARPPGHGHAVPEGRRALREDRREDRPGPARPGPRPRREAGRRLPGDLPQAARRRHLQGGGPVQRRPLLQAVHVGPRCSPTPPTPHRRRAAHPRMSSRPRLDHRTPVR